jgi:hypothetical protein
MIKCSSSMWTSIRVVGRGTVSTTSSMSAMAFVSHVRETAKVCSCYSDTWKENAS